MATPGPFPCPNTPSLCETNPNPSTSFSSETADSTTFIALAWSNVPPALGAPFTITPCEAIADSQVSQADADRIAANAAVVCASGCNTPVFNTAQTASANCSDGSSYFFSVPAGLFLADNQVLADRKAFTAAAQALNGHALCVGNVAPSSVCRGEFYFGIISIITNDNPVVIELISGELPDGLAFTFESTRVVIQGTPSAFGQSRFILKVTSSTGVFTTREFVVTVTGIVTASLPDATVGTDYSVQLQAVIPDGSIVIWSVVSGTLPDGLNLDTATGVISGNPTTAETNVFTVSTTVDGSTCSRGFSLHVKASSIPPHCIVATGTFVNTGAGTPNGPFDGTFDSDTQRMLVINSDASQAIFVDTLNNVVVNTKTISSVHVDGYRYDSNAFSTSNQRWMLGTDVNTITVTDKDGTTIGTISPPVGTNFANPLRACYSPDSDKFYVLVRFFGGDANDHILEYNPHTLALSRDVSLLTTGYDGTIMALPGTNNLAITRVPGFQSVQLFPISTLAPGITSTDSIDVRGRAAFDPVTNQIFVGKLSGVDVVVYDATTLVTNAVITPVTNVGPVQWITYNPITKSIITSDAFSEMSVIDPATNTILCEFPAPSGNAYGINVDYATGIVYVWDPDGAQNPLQLFS